jgi:hypothetical protein
MYVLSLSCYQGIVCILYVELVSSNSVLLSDHSLGHCGLHGNEYAIGSLARSNASLGVGVVSAAVGRNRGWIVTLFEVIKANHSLLEWTFQDGGCWFKLQDQLGFNQSELVCKSQLSNSLVHIVKIVKKNTRKIMFFKNGDCKLDCLP